MQNDGNLVVLDGNDAKTFETNSARAAVHVLKNDRSIYSGEKLSSPNGEFHACV
jgi:hypothetical protein